MTNPTYPTATEVGKLNRERGDARLYRLSEPVKFDGGSVRGETNYVIVSAVNVPLAGPETYIFPATKYGGVINLGELDGSYRGGLDHAAALTGAGYEVIEKADHG